MILFVYEPQTPQNPGIHLCPSNLQQCGVAWRDALALLKALGADIDESRAGSRVGILLHGIPVVMHKPHPSPMLDKGAVVALREYLEQCGILPDEEE